MPGVSDGRPDYQSIKEKQGGDIRHSLSTYVRSIRETTLDKQEFEATFQYLGITE